MMNYRNDLQKAYYEYMQKNPGYRRPLNCLETCKFQGSFNCSVPEFCTNYEYNGIELPKDQIKYIDLGKISYSNNRNYIGCFIELSEMNFERLEKYMNNSLLHGDFKDRLNDFTYHLIEEIETVKPVIIGGSVPVINKTYKLTILYTENIYFIFPLFYDSKYPAADPVRLSIKEIFKKEMDDK